MQTSDELRLLNALVLGDVHTRIGPIVLERPPSMADLIPLLDRIDAFIRDHPTAHGRLRPGCKTLEAVLTALEHPMRLEQRPPPGHRAWSGRLDLAVELIRHVRDRWQWPVHTSLDVRTVKLLIALASRDALVNLVCGDAVYAKSTERQQRHGMRRPLGNRIVALRLAGVLRRRLGAEFRAAMRVARGRDRTATCAPEPGSWAEVLELERRARVWNANVQLTQTEALRRRLRLKIETVEGDLA